MKSKQATVPTFVWLFCDDATNAKGPGCDKRTNLRLRDFAVVPLMPTRVCADINMGGRFIDFKGNKHTLIILAGT